MFDEAPWQPQKGRKTEIDTMTREYCDQSRQRQIDQPCSHGLTSSLFLSQDEMIIVMGDNRHFGSMRMRTVARISLYRQDTDLTSKTKKEAQVA